MAKRAHVCSRLALLLLLAQHFVYGEDFSCRLDGLYADFEQECQEYVRCAGGAVTRRYRCAAGRSFSEHERACVPRQGHACVRRLCAAGDARAYATPGTACRHYYRCDNGTVRDHACPSGAWFDANRGACTFGAGTCYEPLCAGLSDGRYPDASHECRRTLECRGGRLAGAESCAGACSGPCPGPRAGTVPLPAGDADFCSDEACSSLCQHAADGAYADRSVGCREYFACESQRVTRRGVCEPGMIFSGGGCVPAAQAACPPPGRSACYNRPDGLYRDWRDCSSWLECRRERAVGRGSCEAGLAFDGAACVPAGEFPCEGPEPAAECEGRPSGTYQDPASNCTRYFHCEGSLRTRLSCGAGLVFDGAACVRGAGCGARAACAGRADGRHAAGAGAGCRGYVVCARGERAVYACAPGEVFAAGSCVRARPGLCTLDDYSCRGLADGYHTEVESGCQRYFYCEGGDRLATLSCRGEKLFDGHSCVDPSKYDCGVPRTLDSGGNCERDGFFHQPGTGCTTYYFCVTGTKTYLNCPLGQVFNGQICVSDSQYTCPG